MRTDYPGSGAFGHPDHGEDDTRSGTIHGFDDRDRDRDPTSGDDPGATD